jgi:tape measure domain-containing protein
MQFDNRQFESGAQTSMNTLNKLNQSLQLTEASKGLEKVGKTAGSMNLSGLSNGIGAISTKFSSLQVMAITALANITNSAVNAGKKITNSLTIEPIKMGFKEYETQIGAVQTILANTESKGSTLDDVNNALDELNTYADKTIYNFTEMTRNIGTFTAAGVDLDKSVTSIKGIANLAAVSGSTSQQASTAMYQLSQALAAGKVQLMDWNSVVNAGMGGQVFQDALKRTAKNMGTNVDAMIKKYGSFRESLTKGEWLTAEVLTETLTQLSGAYSEADLIAQGYSEKQAKEIVKLSETAVNAATKVKTFTQLIDTLKEAAQSGWTQTWELIVGDFEEAKLLWTEVSDELGKIIGKSAESRNALVKGTMQSNWDRLVEKMDEAGIASKDFEEKIKKTAKAHKVDVDALVKEHGTLGQAIKEGAISTDILNTSVAELGKKLPNLEAITKKLEIGNKGKDVKELQKALKTLDFDVKADGSFGKQTQNAVKAFQKANKLKVTGIVDEKTLAALEKATISANELSSSVSGLISNVTQLGGRDLLIDSLRNAFEAVKSVVTPIKEAFRDIFPAPTAKQLYNIIEAFHSFTEKLILNEKQQEKVKNTFKGLFAGIDIVVTIIKAAVSGIAKLIGNFSGLGGGILGVTSKIGNFISGIRDSVDKTNIFEKAIGAVVGVLSKVIGKIKEVVSFLKEKIQLPGFEGFVKIFGKVFEIVQKVGDKIRSIAPKISEAFRKAFTLDNIQGGATLFNSGMFGATLIAFTTFASSLTKSAKKIAVSFEKLGGLKDIFKDFKKIGKNIGGVLDTVNSSFELWQKDVNSKIILKIAAAIGILAVALTIISLLDTKKLAASLGAVTVLFGDLMASLAVTDVIGNKNGFKSAISTINTMIGVSVAVLILATALKKVADIPIKQLIPGLIAVYSLVGMVVGAMVILSQTEAKGIKGAGSLILFAAAIKVLASVVKDLSSMNFSELATGLFGVGVLMAAVSIFLNKTDMKGKSAGAAVGILILSAAIKVLASATKDFAKMNIEQLAKGLGSVGLMLFALSKFTNSTSGAKGMISMGIGLVLVGAAMKILASAVKDLGTMDPQALGLGLAGMVVGLYAIVEIMKRVPKDMLVSSIALVIVAAALSSLAKTMVSLGGMKLGEIGKALLALGGSLAILAIALHFMQGAIGGAFALIVAAGAIAILAPALAMLGGMSLAAIGKSLLMIAGVFVIFGVAASLLTPVIPAMLGVAGAIALLGVAVLAAGAGVLLLGTGIGVLAAALAGGATAIMAGLTVIVTGLATLSPTVATAVANAIIAFVQALGVGAPIIGAALLAILDMLIILLGTFIPKVIELVVVLITKLLETVAKYMPRIIQAGCEIIIGLLKGLRDNIGEIIIIALELIANFIVGIGKGIGKVVDAAFNLIINFIDGLAEAIDKNTDRLIAAVRKLGKAVLKALGKIFTSGISDIKKVGKMIMESGFIKGLKDKFSDAKKTIKELPGKLKAGLKEKISDLKSAGKDMMNGFIDGIKAKMKSAADAAKSVGKSALSSIKKVLGIKSPARELIKVGKFSDLGFAKGLVKFAGNVSSAAKDVGSVALDGIRGAMSRVSDLVNSDIDSQPTIRPVLDLSDVEAGAGAINGMFGMTPSVGVMSNLGAISSMMSSNQNGGNDDVVSAIKDLRDSIGNMSGNTTIVNGVTYDDGTNIANAVQTLARAAVRERRI